MMGHRLSLHLLDDTLAVCRLPPGARPPGWAGSGDLWAVIRTPDELTVVCREDLVPGTVRAERSWRALKVQGPLEFTLTGVLAALAEPLARAGIPVFALSTYDTDYLLVKMENLERAIQVLRQAGHTIIE